MTRAPKSMKQIIHSSCAHAISDECLLREEIKPGAIPGFAEALAAEAWDRCTKLLADHVRAKPPASFCPYVGDRPPVEPTAIEEAERILEGVFTLPDSRGGTITERLTGDFEWSPSYAGHYTYYPPKMFRYSLNQHEPLSTLANAYWRSSRPEFRDRTVELLLDWVRRVSTYWELLPSGELERQHWQNMMTRNRFEKWLHFFPLIAEVLSDRDVLDLLKAMVIHSRLMARYVATHIGSHISATLAGMLKVNLKFAIMFLETLASEEAKDSFKLHFGAAVDTVFYPDGGLKYRCTGYHKAVSAWYVQAVSLADELRMEGIEHERHMARLMEAYTAYLSKPDGSLPLLGDTGVGSDPQWQAKLKELRPDQPSQAFPWSGLYAMRSGWDAEATYLFFTAGPHGTMHNHQDYLSFEASAYGRPLIVEPGITPYGRIEQRDQLLSSPAHNTVTVDGLGQHRVHVEPTRPCANPWVIEDRFEFVEGVFNEGFGPERSLDVVHVRSVCFIKPDAFLVVDRLLGEGEHCLRWHFMFHPQSMRVHPDERIARSEEREAANVCFTWDDEALRLDLVVGETEPPYRGMMTADGDRPSPSLFLERQAVLPYRATFLIEPLRPGAEPRLSLVQPLVEEALAFIEANTAIP